MFEVGAAILNVANEEIMLSLVPASFTLILLTVFIHTTHVQKAKTPAIAMAEPRPSSARQIRVR